MRGRFVALLMLGSIAAAATANDPPGAPMPSGSDRLMQILGEKPEAKPEECPPTGFNFSKVPPTQPLARFGNFIIPPAGCHYYTLIDFLSGQKRETPKFPLGLYSLNSQPSYDYDFRYLDDPNNTQTSWTDGLKRIRIGDNVLSSFGGELHTRYVNERNSQGTGITNNNYQIRTRLYGDAWYRDEFRTFVEFMYAETMLHNLPPLAIDGNGADLLNAFVEAKAGAPLGTPAYFRIGRQEMTLGSQRLISIPDWANIRRTFQGARGYWHSESINVDAFWLQPVIPNRQQFDSIDSNAFFYGLWTTYRVRPGTAIDLYYLGLSRTANVRTQGDVQTLGSRYSGDVDGQFLFDGEGAVQFGERGGRPILAQMATGGLGWRFKNLPGNVHVWAYYDYASGDPNPDDTTASYRTFNQLFGFGHYYLGLLDLAARQNIRDLNFHVYSNPMPWITTISQVHLLRLDSRRDALYNAVGVPIRRDPTGLAGDNVGAEIDTAINLKLTMHQDVLIGYSKLFAGNFWKATGPPGNPDLVYVQYTGRW